MFELTTGADALGLQSVADMAELHRRHGRVSVRKNVCLITLNGSLNGLGILNIYPTANFTAGSGINFTSQDPDSSPRREDLLEPDRRWRRGHGGHGDGRRRR